MGLSLCSCEIPPNCLVAHLYEGVFQMDCAGGEPAGQSALEEAEISAPVDRHVSPQAPSGPCAAMACRSCWLGDEREAPVDR